MTTSMAILYGVRRTAVRDLERTLASIGGVDGLGLRFAVRRSDVAEAIAAALDTPVGRLAADAWTNVDDVRRACRSTADRDGAREHVRLLEHAVTSTQAIDVEVEIGGTRQAILTLTLRTVVGVKAVTVVVEAGRVAAIRPGVASASVALSINGVQVASGVATDIPLGLGDEPRRRAA